MQTATSNDYINLFHLLELYISNNTTLKFRQQGCVFVYICENNIIAYVNVLLCKLSTLRRSTVDISLLVILYIFV